MLAIEYSFSKFLGDGVSYPQRTLDEVTNGLLDERANWVEDESDDNGKVVFGNLYKSASRTSITSDMKLLSQ